MSLEKPRPGLGRAVWRAVRVLAVLLVLLAAVGMAVSWRAGGAVSLTVGIVAGLFLWVGIMTVFMTLAREPGPDAPRRASDWLTFAYLIAAAAIVVLSVRAVPGLYLAATGEKITAIAGQPRCTDGECRAPLLHPVDEHVIGEGDHRGTVRVYWDPDEVVRAMPASAVEGDFAPWLALGLLLGSLAFTSALGETRRRRTPGP